MTVDAETGLKKLSKIRLDGVTDVNGAIKGMYDLLKSIKDGEVTTKKSGPDFKTFREHYKKVCGKTPVSACREDNCLKHWQNFFGPALKIGQITPRQILAYRGKLLQRGLSPSTANHHVKALRAMLRLAKTERYISKLPFEGIKQLKVRQVERKLFSTDDILKIGTAALRSRPITGEQFADFLLLCMYSGGRKSEVANLKWENVDWDNKQLVFQGDTTKNFESRRGDFSRSLVNHLRCMKAKAYDGVKLCFRHTDGGNLIAPRVPFSHFKKWLRRFAKTLDCLTSRCTCADTFSFQHV